MKSNRSLIKEEMEKLLATLREGIQDRQINTFTTKTKKILGSNWSYLPNCGNFEIQVFEENNPPMAIAGIEKHIDPIIKIEALSSRIQDGNKFMRYQIRLLQRLAKEDTFKFWRRAYKLMARSNSFRVSAWNHVYPKWHREMPLWSVITINKKLSKIIKNGDSKMKFKRVYIPKPPADWRPLGVPTPEWRLYTFMLGAMLGIQFLPTLLPTQHGFRPNMGSLSAWKALVDEKVLDADYIYEIDLQQYFPTIKLRPILTELYASGVPAGMVRHIEDLCRQQPTLPPEELWKLDESHIVRQHAELATLYKRYPPSILSLLTEISFRQLDPNFTDTLPEGSLKLHSQVDQILDDMYSGNYNPERALKEDKNNSSIKYMDELAKWELAELHKRYPPSITSQLAEKAFAELIPGYNNTEKNIRTDINKVLDESIEDIFSGDFDSKKINPLGNEEETELQRELDKLLGIETEESNSPNGLTDWEEGDELAKWDAVLQWGGLPQGSGISPILTSLPLRKFYGQHPSISYADDGLFYWNKLEKEEEKKLIKEAKATIINNTGEENNPILKQILLGDPRKLIKDDKEDGIIIHPSPLKSKFVKFKGVWLCPIKFLGLEYNGLTDMFRARTRKGANIELPTSMKDDLTLAWQVISEDMEKHEAKTKLVGPNYHGFTKKIPNPNQDPIPPMSLEAYLLYEEYKESKFIAAQKTGRALILEDKNPELEDIRKQVQGLPELTGRSPKVRRSQGTEKWKQSIENYKFLCEKGEEYVKMSYVENETDNPYRSWSKLFGSKLIGVIQSRLYANDFELKGLEQDFKYTFSKGSWASQHYGNVDKKLPKENRLTVFTSSSTATMSLLHMLDDFQLRAYGPSGKVSHKDTTDFKKKQFENFRVYYR